MSVDLPEWELPIRIIPTGVAEIEQGSPEEIQQRVFALLCFEPGDLTDLPGFGISDQLFQMNGTDLDVISNAIGEWVPDAREVIDRDPQWFQTLVETVTIRRTDNA